MPNKEYVRAPRKTKKLEKTLERNLAERHAPIIEEQQTLQKGQAPQTSILHQVLEHRKQQTPLPQLIQPTHKIEQSIKSFRQTSEERIRMV